MNILKQKLLRSIKLLSTRELYKLVSRPTKQESTLEPALGKCLPQKILAHCRKHFNPISLVDLVSPKELSGNLPEFVRELQSISNNFPINHEVLTIDKIQKRLCQLKSGKASNNADLELLKKHVNAHLCFKLFVEWQIAYGQTSISLPFRGIYTLKTLWMGQGSTTDPSKHG